MDIQYRLLLVGLLCLLLGGCRSLPTPPTSTLALAQTLRQQERYPEAEHLYAQWRRHYLQTLGPDHAQTQQVTVALGKLLEQQGLYAQAEPLFLELYRETEQSLGPLHPKTLYAIHDLALHYEDQGRFELAGDLYQKTLQRLQQTYAQDHSDVLDFQEYLADLYALQKQFRRAEILYEQVVALREKQWGIHHTKTLALRHKLAQMHLHQNNLQQAETHLTATLVSRYKSSGAEHPETLRSKHHLATLYHRQGKLPEAAKLLDHTLTTTHRLLGHHHPHSLETLHTLATVKEAQNDITEAIRLSRLGFQRRTEFLGRQLWSAGGNSREGILQLHRPELDSYLSLLARLKQPEKGRLALEAGVLRKGLLLKITSEIQHVSTLSKNPKIAQLAAQLVQQRKRLTALTLAIPSGDALDRHHSALVALEKQVEDTEVLLGKESLRFQKLIADPTIEALMEALPDASVLVDFLLYHQGDQMHLLAGILHKTQGKSTFHQINYGNFQPIQAEIAAFREIIQDQDAEDEAVNAVGQHLHALLWQPLERALGSLTQIYLVPDGYLNLLPFNALVDPKNRYLIETLDLHFLTSSRELLHPKPLRTNRDSMVVAGPDYTEKGVTEVSIKNQIQNRHPGSFDANLRSFAHPGLHGLAFDELPGAEKEGRLILEILQATQGNIKESFQRVRAQERVFRTMKTSPALLHIATHGFFLEADPEHQKRLLKRQRGGEGYVPPPGDNPLLRSGLAFAGINKTSAYLGEIDTDNDGILTAYEVLALDLSGTQVAVLSACETGLGEIHTGEGVYGLRRAFMEAGVGAVINSLWEVSDAGTQTLMTGFYRNLMAGQPPTVALRTAQRTMVHSAEWGYPYIWSTFFLVGR